MNCDLITALSVHLRSSSAIFIFEVVGFFFENHLNFSLHPDGMWGTKIFTPDVAFPFNQTD